MSLILARATAHVRAAARLDTVLSPLAKYRTISHSRIKASAVQLPRVMGRGGDGEEHTVSSATVIDSVGREEEHPIRVNPRTDKFGVKRFHHIEFWVADATAAAKRCVRACLDVILVCGGRLQLKPGAQCGEQHCSGQPHLQ